MAGAAVERPDRFAEPALGIGHARYRAAPDHISHSVLRSGIVASLALASVARRGARTARPGVVHKVRLLTYHAQDPVIIGKWEAVAVPAG